MLAPELHSSHGASTQLQSPSHAVHEGHAQLAVHVLHGAPGQYRQASWQPAHEEHTQPSVHASHGASGQLQPLVHDWHEEQVQSPVHASHGASGQRHVSVQAAQEAHSQFVVQASHGMPSQRGCWQYSVHTSCGHLHAALSQS